MNKEDGTWRMIYVGPAGQLIGSLKPPQTFQIPGVGGTQPGTLAGSNAQQGSGFGACGFGPASPSPGTPQNTAPRGCKQNGQARPHPPDNPTNDTPHAL